MEPEKRVIIGGTFDILHSGHKALLRKAFSMGKVFIGLTSDKMGQSTQKRQIIGFEKRKAELENFIKNDLRNSAEIIAIEDKFGSTLDEDFDFIVVSPETYAGAVQINEERKKRNKKPIEIIKIDFVLAEDGNPISSTRIYEGEIDKDGKVLK